MAFADDIEVSNRLRNNPALLSKEEISDIIQFIPRLGGHEGRILNVHLALLTMQALDENRDAIERFNQSSTKLATRVYWLTWALMVLTVVLTVFTVLLWWRP